MLDWQIVGVIATASIVALFSIIAISDRDWHTTMSMAIAATVFLNFSIPFSWWLFDDWGAVDWHVVALSIIVIANAWLMVWNHRKREILRNVNARHRRTGYMWLNTLVFVLCVVISFYLEWRVYHG